MRVMLLTVPSQRDALTRALREAAIEALAEAALWPADGRSRRPRPRPDRGLTRRSAACGQGSAGLGRLGRLPHGLDRRRRPGPQRELRRRLVHEHAQAVERRRRPRRPPRPASGVGRGA